MADESASVFCNNNGQYVRLGGQQTAGSGTTLSGDEIKARLQRMDDWDFEHFVADLWARQGWETQVEQHSTDAGVDVHATKSDPYPQKTLIQAKRYQEGNTVGGPDVQQYASLKHQEPGVDTAVIVTTSSFSKHARERARDLNVKLIDGDDLVGIVASLNAHDLVGKYTGANEVTASPAGTDAAEANHELEILIPTSFTWWVIVLSMGASLTVWLVFLSLPTIFETIAFAVGFLALVVQAMTIFLDATRIKGRGWDPSGLYPILSLLPGLNIIVEGVYLLKRSVST